MNAEIICVGTELLLGDIVNTNAQYLSQRLSELGISVFEQVVVGDNVERLKKVVEESMLKADIIILSGGLGPTPDDLTKETVAKLLDLELVNHDDTYESIRTYFAGRGMEMPLSNAKQAMVPETAMVLKNDNGTAPGLVINKGKNIIIMLPGPPAELIPMFDKYIVPYFKKQSSDTIYSTNINIIGIGESAVAEKLGDLLKSSNPTVATYAQNGEVRVRVTAKADKDSAKRIISSTVQNIVGMFKDNIYGIDEENIQSAVVKLLKEKGKKIATAESCTAGIISGMITDVPGASEVFEMGITAYSNSIKEQALGIRSKLLLEKGAVSPEVACEMAKTIAAITGADIGIGITGVAGPGQSEQKPEGLVYVALSAPNQCFVKKLELFGGRDKIRNAAAKQALDMARRYLQNVESFMEFGFSKGEEMKIMEDFKPKEEPALNEDKPITLDDIDLHITPVVDKSEFLNTDDTEEDFWDTDNIESFKKRNFFRNLFWYKDDSKGEKIRKTVFLAAFVTFIVTAVAVGMYFISGIIQRNNISTAAKVWEAPNAYEKNADGIFVAFESLIKQNSDIKGWIKISGTNVNNPVYQTTNNDYYINHNMLKQTSRYGAVFADYENKITKDGNSQGIVLYGHHMRDGSMFASLKQFRSLDFYKQNSVIDFTTLYERNKYKIFCVMITNALPSGDNGHVFSYRYSDFSSQEAFLNYTEELKKRSIINANVDIQPDDELLTLSTCIYDFTDARLVVVARKVREGETNYTDTAFAAYNPNTYYPAAYYGKNAVPAISSVPQSGVVSNISAIQSTVEPASSIITSSSAGTAAASSRRTTNTGSKSTVTSSKPSSNVTSTESVFSETPTVSETPVLSESSNTEASE